MTDTPLLRLAKLVQSLAARTSGHELYDDARRLVDDLEAANARTAEETDLAHWPDPPAPERRTITREELKWLEGWVGTQATPAILRHLRLTVEDA